MSGKTSREIVCITINDVWRTAWVELNKECPLYRLSEAHSATRNICGEDISQFIHFFRGMDVGCKIVRCSCY